MKKKWNSPVYAFFKPDPSIEYTGGQWSHVFRCNAKGCAKLVCRFLDKGDAWLMGNMHKHIKKCWGEDILDQVMQMWSFSAAHLSRVISQMGLLLPHLSGKIRQKEHILTSCIQRHRAGEHVHTQHLQHLRSSFL